MTTVITFKLDRPYLIEAILVLGMQREVTKQLSEFHLYVGYDSDYTKNTPCSGGPFAYPLTADYGTNLSPRANGSDWINGAEVWCNIDGLYVSFVREATA